MRKVSALLFWITKKNAEEYELERQSTMTT